MNKVRSSLFILSLLALTPLRGWSQETDVNERGDFLTAPYIESDTAMPTDSVTSVPVLADPIYDDNEVEEFGRDTESVVFIPKGQWMAGVSVSYTQSNQNNYQFLILENISGDTYSFKVSPKVCYMVKDDLGIGASFAYTRSLTKLENADLVIDSETDYSIEKLYRLSHNYYATVFMRNYFSLGNSKRFGFFSQLQCQLGGGQSKMMKGAGADLSGVYETNFSVDVGLSPGLMVFLSNYSALEVNVGVLGFSYTHTKSISDRIYRADRRSKSANFRINLFSITFGVAFYL